MAQRAVLPKHPGFTTNSRQPIKTKCSPKQRIVTKSAATKAADTATTTFADLLANAADCTTLQLERTGGGRGLVAAADTPAAQHVILRVPLDACLVVDYTDGVRLPAGQWLRVRGGLAKDDALPWDLIQALALLDSLAGDGNVFWSQYANDILPQPLSLALPFCLPERLLVQLGHADVIGAAREQKQRLAALFPGLAIPIAGDGPTYLEWAFACVRSRAFKLGKDCFAFLPFVDAANHSMEPNADFRLAPGTPDTVELVSLKPIASGDEVTISYSGPQGYTNQRMMAQYGFVPEAGNPFDRLQFACADGTLLSLDAMQAALGDSELMVDAFSGKNAFLYAALKSLPWAVEESGAAPMADQKALAHKMMEELKAERSTWESSLEDDEEALQAAAAGADERETAVVRYRLHRKKLIEAAGWMLQAFLSQ